VFYRIVLTIDLVILIFQVKEKSGMRCLDTMGQQVGGGPIGISGCHHFGGNQV